MSKLILITNDDGYNANGIKALVDVAKEFGRVIVVAPDKSWSGKSHSVTLDNPVYVKKLNGYFSEEIETYITSGTPADCIKFALSNLLDKEPDLILSGINHGPNFSINSFYSGTVAAAMEGALNGIPSIALSHISFNPDADMTLAKEHTKILIDYIFSMPDNKGICLNANFPDLQPADSKGIKFTRLARAIWKEEFAERTHPARKQKYYWLTGKFYNFEPADQDTDVWAVENGYTAVVPMTTDLTDYKTLKTLKNINTGLTIKNQKEL